MLRETLIVLTAGGWAIAAGLANRARKTPSTYVGASFQTWLTIAAVGYLVQNLLLIWDPWRNLPHGLLLFSILTRLAQAVFIGTTIASAILTIRGRISNPDGAK